MTFRSEIDGESGAVFLQRVLKERGPLAQAELMPEEVLRVYEGIIPDILLDFWENYGVGDLADGKLRLCLPGAFASVVQQLFRGDPDFARDSHVVAYSAFGDLYIWNERHDLVLVGMALSMVDAPFLFHPDWKKPVDRTILDFVLMADTAVLDMADDDGVPMFDRARDVLGPLGPMQIYGMVPPVPFGEAISVDNLAIVPVEDWLTEKMSGSIFMLSDVATSTFDVRQIGPLPLPDGEAAQ